MGEGGMRPWPRALLICGTVVAGIAIVIGVLWLTVGTRPLWNLSAHVAAADETATVGAVTVPVPAGWATEHPPFDDDTLLLLSPDRDLEITVTTAAQTPDAAFADAAPAASAPVSEILRSGARSIHTRTAPDAIVAVVGADGQSPTAVLAAHATTGDISGYTATIAAVLDGTAVAR
ncbi:MAG: hypothetical protein QM626_05465 [Microbacterium sp.]|uniref:hypothetical protein n=1 Tax=Microbacterium sp. TaxID=51671 RepID=UPI0039E44E2C